MGTKESVSSAHHIRSVKCPELGIRMYLSDSDCCESGNAKLVSLDASDTSFHLWMDTGKFTIGSSGIIERVDCKDYALVLDGDVLVEEDWHDVPHVVADALPLRVGAHGQILLHLAQLVDVSLQ